MSNNSRLIHPLIHEGAGQTSRLLDALIPEHLLLDGRSMQDLIVAAYRYAGLLHYYNEDNQPDGDWRCFWEVETLTFLAVLAELDTEIILQQFNALEVGFAEDIDEGAGGPFDPGGEAITNFYDQAQFIHQLALQVQKAYQGLPESLALKREIAAMIDKQAAFDGENLVDALRQLIAIHKEAYSDEHGQALPYSEYAPFFSDLWGLPDSDAFDAIRFQAAFTREEMRALFRRFYEILVKIRQRAQYWFNQLISEPRLHQPHVALFLAFLRLFRHAQDSLNALSKKHLDYFYEKILCLDKRPAVPDDVFLVFELAKGFEESLIEKGTAFLAGKDKNGRPLLFEAMENWVIRSAQAVEIKNTHFDLCGFQGTGNILASPDVNTAYQNGEILPNEKPASWRAMGDDAELPPGEIGFAVASPQLILREGKRVVDVVINLAGLNTALNFSSNDFRIMFSSPEAWIEPVVNNDINFTADDKVLPLERASFKIRLENDTLLIRAIFERDDLPIDSLGEELALEAGYDTRWPVMKALLSRPEHIALFYEETRLLKFEEIKISVDVSGIRENLIIQSDQGVFDGTQKIYPFGPVPAEGHRFYVGSTEVFQKALNSLKVKFDWIAAPENFQEYYAEYNIGDYAIPNPKARIDFIDRADDRDISITQILRVDQNGGNEIRVKISNVNFDPVDGAAFQLLLADGTLANLSGSTPEPGQYQLLLPPNAVLTDAQLIVSKPGEDFEPLSFPIQENGITTTSFEIVLFPLKKNFLAPTSRTGLVRKLEDGGFLTAVTLNGTPRALTNGAYSEGLSSNALNFELSGYNDNNISNPQGYSVIDAYMRPVSYVPQQVIKSPPNERVNILLGLKDADGNAISGASLDINGDIQSVNDGSALPDIVGDANLKLSKSGFQDLWIPLEYATLLNAVLLPNAGTEVVPRGSAPPGTVSIVIQNWENIPLANTAFNVKIGNNASTTEISDNSGAISLGSYTATEDVEVSHPHFLPFIISNFAPDTSATVKLATESFSSSTGATSTSVDVTVINLEGVAVSGVEVEAVNGSGAVISGATDGFGQATLSGLSGSGWSLKLKKDNAAVISPPTINVRNRKIVINIGQVEKSRPFTGTLRGRLTNTAGSPVSGALVMAGNQEQRSNSRGEYFFSGLSAPPTSGVSFFHPLYQFLPTVAIEDDSVIDAMLLPHLQYFVYEGKITDIFSVPLPGVEIGIKTNNDNREYIIEASDSNGQYRVLAPTALASDVELFFRSPGYEEVRLDFPTTSIPSGSSASLLDVRLSPDLGNLSPLLDGPKMEDLFDIRINALNLKRDIRTQYFERYDPTLKRGFVRFTLAEDDFRHPAYPHILAWYTMAASGQITLPGITIDQNAPPPLPNQPYTPATNGISLSYTSEQIITKAENNGIDQYFHLLPFNGHKEISLLQEGDIRLICPYWAHDNTEQQFATGNLYLGLEKLKPGANLSLLFQIEEGSERKAEWRPPRLVWSYLTKGNRWTAFESTDFLLDTTGGLTLSGLVQLKIPKTAVTENTMLNPALHWIRIAAVEALGDAIPVSVRALPNLVSVRAQAIQARFADRQNDLAHLGEPLPAGTIAKLEVSRTAVKKVEQPFDSFGGRLPEQGNEFYRRISERLRHRDRAITLWDYERLLLEQFPKVHRVKCLPHTRMIASTDNCSTPTEQNIADMPPGLSVMAPGYVLLAVIPDLARRTATRQAEPRFSFGDLMEMEDYLRTKTNLFVAWQKEAPPWLCEPETFEDETKYLWVVNPRYEPVRLSFKVAFLPGFDEAYFKFQLDQELKNHLAPWIENPAAEITFGQTLYHSRIIAFIESREYVDAIADFKLYQAPASYLLDGLPEDCLTHGGRAIPSTPRSVLTTYIRAEKGPDETDHHILVADKTTWCLPSGRNTRP